MNQTGWFAQTGAKAADLEAGGIAVGVGALLVLVSAIP
jgi:hypothetical protein